MGVAVLLLGEERARPSTIRSGDLNDALSVGLAGVALLAAGGPSGPRGHHAVHRTRLCVAGAFRFAWADSAAI